MCPSSDKQGVGYHEIECVPSETNNCTAKDTSLYSKYRNESEKGLVGLREVDGTVSWGWTSHKEWLGYTIVVSYFSCRLTHNTRTGRGFATNVKCSSPARALRFVSSANV